MLVTSGIDGTYPPGLAVARVATLERETGQMFARITARPLAGVDRSEYLLVLGHASAPPAARKSRPRPTPRRKPPRAGGGADDGVAHLMPLAAGVARGDPAARRGRGSSC